MEFTKSAPFSIELGARGDDPQLTFVKVIGDMDYVSGAEIAAAVRRPLETGQSVVIDLAEVTFMDSSGIAAILTVAREDRARERLRLIPPTHRQPARLADLTGMTALFTLYEG